MQIEIQVSAMAGTDMVPIQIWFPNSHTYMPLVNRRERWGTTEREPEIAF
jgi:hypothetical protein